MQMRNINSLKEMRDVTVGSPAASRMAVIEGKNVGEVARSGFCGGQHRYFQPHSPTGEEP
jgi:hypothetical protein